MLEDQNITEHFSTKHAHCVFYNVMSATDAQETEVLQDIIWKYDC